MPKKHIPVFLILFLSAITPSAHAQDFDTSTCFNNALLKPNKTYKISRSTTSGIGSDGELVRGYVLEGELVRVWNVKKGLFHWGETTTRAKNVKGAFWIGTDITDVGGSVSLRAKAGPQGAKVCFCDGYDKESQKYFKELRKQANATPPNPSAQLKLEEFRKKREACFAQVKSLLPPPPKKVPRKRITICPRVGKNGECMYEP